MPLTLLLVSTMFVGLIGLPLASNAAINKCTGTDGKVVFSDQPCLPGQSAAVVQGAGDAAKKREELIMGITLLQLHPNIQLTPECERILEQAKDEIANTPAERLTQAGLATNKALNRFKLQCSPLVKQAARDAAAMAAMDKGQIDQLLGKMGCADKQRLYDQRNEKLGTPSGKEQEFLTSLAANIKNNCR